MQTQLTAEERLRTVGTSVTGLLTDKCCCWWWGPNVRNVKFGGRCYVFHTLLKVLKHVIEKISLKRQ